MNLYNYILIILFFLNTLYLSLNNFNCYNFPQYMQIQFRLSNGNI